MLRVGIVLCETNKSSRSLSQKSTGTVGRKGTWTFLPERASRPLAGTYGRSGSETLPGRLSVLNSCVFFLILEERMPLALSERHRDGAEDGRRRTEDGRLFLRNNRGTTILSPAMTLLSFPLDPVFLIFTGKNVNFGTLTGLGKWGLDYN